MKLEPIPELIRMPCAVPWLWFRREGTVARAANFQEEINHLSPLSPLTNYRQQVRRGLVPLSQPNQMKIKIKELLAMNTLASKDEERPEINSVLIEATPERTLLIATDGRRLGILKSEPGWPSVSINVPRALIERLEKIRGEETEVSISAEYGPVIISGEDFEITAEAQGGNFPEWRRLIHRDAVAWKNIKCNPDYLQSFSDLVRLLGGGTNCMMIIKSYGEGFKPLEITFQGFLNFYGLLMQQRYTEDPPSTAWVKQLAEEK